MKHGGKSTTINQRHHGGKNINKWSKEAQTNDKNPKSKFPHSSPII